jgi:hypothetical protein
LYCTEGGCSIHRLNLLSGAPVAIFGEGNVLDHTVLWEKASVVCSAGTSYSHMTVNSAGTIQVHSGASAAGVILSSGAGLIYSSGAKITDAQYSSGAVLNCNVWGHDTETVFEGTHDMGSFTLSNGTASGLVLGSGNRLAASYYGQVSHVTAQS